MQALRLERADAVFQAEEDHTETPDVGREGMPEAAGHLRREEVGSTAGLSFELLVALEFAGESEVADFYLVLRV